MENQCFHRIQKFFKNPMGNKVNEKIKKNFKKILIIIYAEPQINEEHIQKS